MNLLLTNHRLRQRGGSELFVAEVAVELQRRGHRVCVFSTVPGEISGMLQEQNVPVVSSPADCPFRPDLIHGQHHLETMAALSLWPGVPGVYFLHGATPWEEHPPVHPRLRRYLATSPRFGWWVAQECGVSETSLEVVRNFFDAARFPHRRPPGQRTGRALVFHNTMLASGPAFHALQAACQAVGLTLDGVGEAFGKTDANPGRLLPGFDVVFAGGRSAIEAMACGCAVLPVTALQAEGRVHPGNFEEMADRNFTAETNAPPIQTAAVAAELRRIRPEETESVTRRIRNEFALERAADRLLEIYASVMAESPEISSDPDSESRAVGTYLVSLAARVKDADARRAKLVQDKETAACRAEVWKQRAASHQARMTWLETQAETAPWWQRRWWRRLRRQWESCSDGAHHGD